MDIRERHFGPITAGGSEGQKPHVDLDALIHRLLLFEHCYLESDSLIEIPAMVRTFGYQGVMRLIEDPSFEIISDVMTAGSVGQTFGLQITERRGGILPLGSYSLVSLTASREEGFDRVFQSLPATPSLTDEQRRDLIRKLRDKLIRYPLEAATVGLQDYDKDLQAGDLKVLPTLQNIARKELGITDVEQLRVEVEKLPFEGDYRVQTNLQTDFGVDEPTAHKVVEQVLLGMAALNQRIHLIEALNAVTGFQDADVPLFEAKLQFLAAQLDPVIQEHRLERVVRVGELPSIATGSPSVRVDIGRLLRLRDDTNCVELRRWLRSTDGQSDSEMAQQFGSIKEKLAGITHSRIGKAIRFAATNGLGFIPGLGTVLGPITTLADQFIVERLIGMPGPVYFLSRQYRSIFQG